LRCVSKHEGALRRQGRRGPQASSFETRRCRSNLPRLRTRALLRMRAARRVTSMANDTIVDIYCHIFPDAFFQEMNRIAPRLGNIGARLRSVKKLFDLDARFRGMEQFGDYREMISLPNPAIEDFAFGNFVYNPARIGHEATEE